MDRRNVFKLLGLGGLCVGSCSVGNWIHHLGDYAQITLSSHALGHESYSTEEMVGHRWINISQGDNFFICCHAYDVDRIAKSSISVWRGGGGGEMEKKVGELGMIMYRSKDCKMELSPPAGFEIEYNECHLDVGRNRIEYLVEDVNGREMRDNSWIYVE